MSQHMKWPIKMLKKIYLYQGKYINTRKLKHKSVKNDEDEKRYSRFELTREKWVIQKEAHKCESNPNDRNAKQIQAGLLIHYTRLKYLPEKDSNFQPTVFLLFQCQMLISLSYRVSRRITKRNRVIKIASGKYNWNCWQLAK